MSSSECRFCSFYKQGTNSSSKPKEARLSKSGKSLYCSNRESNFFRLEPTPYCSCSKFVRGYL